MTPGSPWRSPSAMNCVASDGLARAAGPGDQHRVPAGNPAPEHLVEPGHAGRQAPVGPRRSPRLGDALDDAREDLQAVRR